ncbi:urease accessory protein UreF [Paenibacillus sp. LMG 31458]|uniref:Urease accessory protein UreF n=1 Tax=Paenibacillus phytorum TaxID=2654977 RepID=A0ABX1Y0C3_9BACL|nr:urease accessory protein UreF [Paenibacillus phytorum]NOU74231.1 urease accessory protein UreF [Paenibacillus phytorum]
MDKILSLFQLCDSNFPTGAFSHSYGLESYIQENIVDNPDTFTRWLHVYLNEQLVYSDGLACHLVYEALEEENFHKVWKLDRLLTVQNLPRETREGTQKMGDRMLNLVGTLYDAPILAAYRKRINEKQSFGHPAIVFTMIAQYLEVPKCTTILYYLYSVVSSLVQNAVRAIPLGQTAGQKIIHEIQSELIRASEKIQQMDEEYFGIVSPGLEISQMIHERVNIRIFMS